ncbi:MAG: 23S rRNA (adenine(2030)-N(6))-methyltransferase RlmJ [Nevskia sp.]
MHYRHSFHAGNFADVFKHVLVVGLLMNLSRKDKPWCYLDTHAGAGDYDLGSELALRTGEWRDGIERLIALKSAPEPLATFLALVRAANPDGGLRNYPGSPRFAQKLSRPGDRLVLCERVPEVAEELKFGFRAFANTVVHLRDGYEAHALLPPVEKRGLMLIDPPFERPDEFDAVAELMKKSMARFAGGVYAAWYPLKNTHLAAQFARRIARESPRPVLNLSIDTDGSKDAETRETAPGLPPVIKHPMSACGLIVANPPFGFEEQARETLEFMMPLLAQGSRPSWSVATPN